MLYLLAMGSLERETCSEDGSGRTSNGGWRMNQRKWWESDRSLWWVNGCPLLPWFSEAYDMLYSITKTAYSFCISSYHFNSSTHTISCLSPLAKNDRDLLYKYITLWFCLDCWTMTHLATKVINWQKESERWTGLLLSSLSQSWQSESDDCSEVTPATWNCTACPEIFFNRLQCAQNS